MTTTRERLDARRQRIAAGFPPPVAVTVTPAFLESMAPQPRKCIVPGCEREFTPRSSRELTCGAECCKKAYSKDQRQRKRVKKTPLGPRICAAERCEREFMPKNPRHMTCGAERCKKAYQRLRKAEYQRAYDQRKKDDLAA